MNVSYCKVLYIYAREAWAISERPPKKFQGGGLGGRETCYGFEHLLDMCFTDVGGCDREAAGGWGLVGPELMRVVQRTWGGFD